MADKQARCPVIVDRNHDLDLNLNRNHNRNLIRYSGSRSRLRS